uniref:Uncharacterized protein n=1 Tax=viral metagenome TaxID=1070528 RepID=A0A6C0CQK6_9ZZZZ
MITTTHQVFNGFDPNNENHIFIIIVLRKILIDLIRLRSYHNHIPNIISFVNAIISNNINMIYEETLQFEQIYLNNNDVFKVHPIELIKLILDKGDTTLDLFRSFLYETQEGNLGDIGCLNSINSWLLTTNLNLYKRIIQLIYS